MGSTPKTIVRNGKMARLYRARKTYKCDLDGCTGVILPGQEYYVIFSPRTEGTKCLHKNRVHVSGIEQYFRRDSGRSTI